MKNNPLKFVRFLWCVSSVLFAAAHAQTPLYTFTGDSPGDRFGVSVAIAGDLNRDGIDDLIAGAQLDDDNGLDCGSARVISGSDGSVLHTFYGDHASDFFGFAVSRAGDVDGDGYPDLLIGGFGDDSFGPNSGMARVLSGQDGATLHTFYGATGLGAFGNSVAGVGDVNADGVPDFVIGAVNDSVTVVHAGSARIFSGLDGSVLHVFSGEAVDDLFGVCVANAGDLNGDGVNDVIIGASFTDVGAFNAGSAYAFSGSDAEPLFRFNGNSVGGNLGTSVSGAGDVNGDGVPDLIIGARNDAPAGVATGSAFVISGADGTLLHHFTGAAAGDSFGRSVAGAGDVNGDGFADLIVGASLNDTAGADAGSATVFSGYDGAVLGTMYGAAPGHFFSASVSGAGDLNGDGFADVIVGASVGNSATVFSLASPNMAIDGIANLVTALNLSPAVEQSLLRIVAAAQAILQDANPNNDRAATFILTAFVREVEARRGHTLTDPEADRLREAAERVIGLLDN